jgi:hypothetical protein
MTRNRWLLVGAAVIAGAIYVLNQWSKDADLVACLQGHDAIYGQRIETRDEIMAMVDDLVQKHGETHASARAMVGILGGCER